MICEYCKTVFCPADKARIALRFNHYLELRTRCPHCGEVYYTFTMDTPWASQRKAMALVKATKEAK